MKNHLSADLYLPSLSTFFQQRSRCDPRKVKGNVLDSPLRGEAWSRFSPRSVNVAGVAGVVRKHTSGEWTGPTAITPRNPSWGSLVKTRGCLHSLGVTSQKTPVPRFSQEGTLVAHLPSAQISKFLSLCGLWQQWVNAQITWKRENECS